MKTLKTYFLSLVCILSVAVVLQPITTRAAVDRIEIDRRGGDPNAPIPIFLKGFSSETMGILRFDLEVVGFEIVSAADAYYELSGSIGTTLKAKLTGRGSSKALFHLDFEGASRRHVHTLSDQVVKVVFDGQQKGIARTKIAFKVNFGKYSEIYLSDYDGNNMQQVTSDRSYSAAPCWVPGQMKLYYTSYKEVFPNIYSHDLITGVRHRIAKFPGLNTSPSISPNAQFLAMILSKNGSPDAYVSNLSGGNLTQLTRTKLEEASPCWSPDSKRICFTSRQNGRPRLYTQSVGGGSMVRIPTSSGSAFEPDWSPDGKNIIYTIQSGRSFELWLVPVDAHGNPTGKSEFMTVGEDPSWAPNSRTVIFTRRDRNNRKLSLLDVKTKRVKYARIKSGKCSQPAWAQ
ncbi:MAG TPA: hypothetical protein EYQ50_10650 [Verrucomicrobiales bacterium]|nr:hypothetical protein [Verrucomicrobiales bacterium]HIL71728.1 hypothetical protein [Verrucomicrobiota bacterium]